jgi:Tfp pilus assembly protein PilO
LLYLIIAAITFAIGWVVAFRDTKQREHALRSKERTHKEQIAREEKERAAQHAAIDQKKENLKTFHLSPLTNVSKSQQKFLS